MQQQRCFASDVMVDDRYGFVRFPVIAQGWADKQQAACPCRDRVELHWERHPITEEKKTEMCVSGTNPHCSGCVLCNIMQRPDSSTRQISFVPLGTHTCWLTPQEDTWKRNFDHIQELPKNPYRSTAVDVLGLIRSHSMALTLPSWSQIREEQKSKQSDDSPPLHLTLKTNHLIFHKVCQISALALANTENWQHDATLNTTKDLFRFCFSISAKPTSEPGPQFNFQIALKYLTFCSAWRRQSKLLRMWRGKKAPGMNRKDEMCVIRMQTELTARGRDSP